MKLKWLKSILRGQCYKNSNPQKKSIEQNTIMKKEDIDIFAIILVFICCISLVLYFIIPVFRPPIKQNINRVKISINTNTNGAIDSEGEESAIRNLIDILKQQDNDIQQRYASLIEQKEDEKKLINYSGFIISIIVAILGFFGYKSFKSIEEKALSMAEEALLKAEEKINKTNKTKIDLIQSNLCEDLDKKFLDHAKENKEEISKLVNQKNTKILAEEINPTIDEIKQKINLIESLEKDIEVLKNKLSGIEDSGVVLPQSPDLDLEGDIGEFAKTREEKKNEEG